MHTPVSWPGRDHVKRTCIALLSLRSCSRCCKTILSGQRKIAVPPVHTLFCSRLRGTRAEVDCETSQPRSPHVVFATGVKLVYDASCGRRGGKSLQIRPHVIRSRLFSRLGRRSYCPNHIPRKMAEFCGRRSLAGREGLLSRKKRWITSVEHEDFPRVEVEQLLRREGAYHPPCKRERRPMVMPVCLKIL